MKDNKMILRLFALLLMVWMVSVCDLSGQSYKLGDLYTFDDGSMGIVFYVNPDDPGSGTVAALNDLDGQYALWAGGMPQTLTDVFAPNGGIFFNSIMAWENHGKRFTQVLRESGVSPAANAIDVDAGWYIPDILQLQKLYSSTAFLKDAFENYGGDIMTLWNATHWSATRVSSSSNTVYAIRYSQGLDTYYGTQSYAIRPVRDFPDTAVVQAYWVENAPHGDTVVAPDTTRSYNARVIYRSDTMSLTATVTVHQPMADTLYEAVYKSLSPYTSIVEPLFNDLDISLPGIYEYRDTLSSANGCDSIIVLKLTVGNNVRYADTLCPLKTDFYFAPFDTVFSVGTVSGLYEHHGVKLVDGVPVDTVAYYELTILPEYQRFDTVRRCLYEAAESWTYDGNAHVSIAVNGTSVTMASDTAAIVVEEVTSGTDYNLKMQTVSGCDSVTHLHLDLRRVSRDTVYKDLLITQLVGGIATVACHNFTGITVPGTYAATDTLVATNGCDSIMSVFLMVEPLHTETLCDSVLAADLTWTGNLTGYTWNGRPLPAGVGASGYYEFPGQKTLDGELVDTVFYLQLIVNQKYEVRDTVSFCLYESTFTTAYDLNSAVTITVDAGDGITVTSSDAGVEVLPVPGSVTDFALKMQSTSGCDSVVFLHVDVRRVSRDTVRHYAYMHQVESERITVDGREFTGITGAGTYELHDTLVAANGCDSIIVLKLTVGNNVRYADTLCPLKTDFYFAPFDTVFSVGTVSGLYEHHGVKLVDGVPVDTVAYYDLTILPEYQRFDTVRRCLYETAETWTYDENAHVSIAVDGTSVTMASDTAAIVVEEVTSGTDYNLKMQTVSGCDSVTHLHLDLRRVSRDTVYKDLLITQLVGGIATVACHNFTGITVPGTYAATDTLVATNGCDSIMSVFLMVEPLHTETLCDSVLAADLAWTGNLTGYTWNGRPLPAGVGASGYYEFPGQKTLDGELVDTVSYLQLIVNQKYEAMDTASFCLYEPTFTTTYDLNSAVTIAVDAGDGIAVTSSDAGVEVLPVPGSVTDFALKMQTVSGCDSVVFLHVNVRRVSRDTVRHYAYMHQVESERIMVDGREFTGITGAGTYELRDTLAAANGCDSIVVLKLTVGNNVHYADTLCPLKTDFYFAPFDTVFSVGTVSGLYEHHGVKLVDGVPVDTVAYYDLTILPEYQRFDTVRRCLYETAETWTYDENAHVSIAVDGTSVTMASDTAAVVVEEVTSGTDYNLKMQTVSGCDSVTHLHLDLRRVSRDTVYKDMLITQLVGGAATVACHTFTGITAPGTYAATDTLVATNGCDSIMTLFLMIEPLHTETLCDSVLAADLTWTSNLEGHTWNGQPLPAGVGASGYYEFLGQKTLDGELVDTVSYLQLIVNQKYEGRDTASFCLYEPTFTTTYDFNSAVTITVDAGDGIAVTSSDAGVEVLSVPGSVTDFALKMQTVSGCDSVVFLHVDVRRVSRDTVRHYAYMHQVESERIMVDGREFTGITGAGTYELHDTLVAANGCDSIVVLKLTVGDNVRYADTLCPLKTDFYFAPFDTVFSVGTVSGLYEHHGVKLVDGVPVDTVAYYELTILPEYQRFDTVRRCLYEAAETWTYDENAHVSIAVDGTSVTMASDTAAVVVEEVTSGTDYNLKMQTVSGCDSVTHLHLDLRRVSRDTVYKDLLITQLVGGAATVACHTFTGITALGTYAATDTLAATNSCDSLMTVFLMIEPLHTETLCDSVLAADLTWTGNLAGYTWNGQPLPATVGASGYYEFPGQKTLNGELVDTVSYLQLIVNQKYEERDTVSFCLYEPAFTTAYDLNSAVTITMDAGDGIAVTSSDAGVEVLSVPGSVTDFALKMQTVSGCDSVVFLHVDVRRVSRDTVRHYAYMHQVESERIMVDGREFTGITGAGTYELRDTLVAVNGCDSIVLHELTVEACASGFTILCPPDVYDTLAYGDCAMTIYPDRIGTATVQYDVAWPFAISNNMPSDNLFAQGDNVITWTATDLACGGSVSCEQHVFIAFPQCPDAVDFEGNVYRGVRVGCDCWTQRNLESKRYSDGTDISGRYAYANAQYPDTAVNVAVFGRLYSYEAAVRDTADNGHGHVQGICPKGWYLPTPEKYEGLNAYGADALRSPDYWIIGAGNNSTGFTALPAGYYNGDFDRYEGLLTETYFWSTKSVSQTNPKCLYSITYYCDFVLEKHSYSGLGYSVRCVKEK